MNANTVMRRKATDVFKNNYAEVIALFHWYVIEPSLLTFDERR